MTNCEKLRQAPTLLILENHFSVENDSSKQQLMRFEDINFTLDVRKRISYNINFRRVRTKSASSSGGSVSISGGGPVIYLLISPFNIQHLRVICFSAGSHSRRWLQSSAGGEQQQLNQASKMYRTAVQKQ